jgi:flagellar export protein FliJ
MSKAARLEPLADFAGLVENEAAKRLAASAKAMQSKEAELDQLRGYLAEYRRRAAQGAMDSVRWRNTQLFLTRLSEAVAHQEAELQKAVERHRFETGRWRDSHQRAETLDRVVERAQREAAVAMSRREQAELDEQAMRRHPLAPDRRQ